MGHVLNQLGKQVDAFSRSFAHSFAQELHHDAKALLSDPIGFAQEEIISLGHGIKQATLLTLRFGAACHRIMSSEPAEAERLITAYTRRIGEKLTTLAQHLTAEKLGDLAGRFAGGNVLRRYRTRILGAMTSSTEIAYLAKQADVLAAAVKTNAGLKLAEKSGSKKVNKSIAQLEKDAKQVAGSKNVVKEVEKGIENIASKASGKKGLEQSGYIPQGDERTFDGFVRKNIPPHKETTLHTQSKGFNNNSRGTNPDGQFKRFGTESHAGVSPHVHQPTRHVNQHGETFGGQGAKTSNGGVTKPGRKDIKQLYEYLHNQKYRKKSH